MRRLSSCEWSRQIAYVGLNEGEGHGMWILAFVGQKSVITPLYGYGGGGGNHDQSRQWDRFSDRCHGRLRRRSPQRPPQRPPPQRPHHLMVRSQIENQVLKPCAILGNALLTTRRSSRRATGRHACAFSCLLRCGVFRLGRSRERRRRPSVDVPRRYFWQMAASSSYHRRLHQSSRLTIVSVIS